MKVLTAEERRVVLELQLFEELRTKVIASAPAIRSAVEAVATADALVSFARCAAEYGYTRPQVDAGEGLTITGGRHPVVERMLGAGESFVPNDVRLDPEDAQLLVITGPNMAGKSTVMRQVALTALMAQAGSFVPAKAARIGLCDHIFTRVGALRHALPRTGGPGARAAPGEEPVRRGEGAGRQGHLPAQADSWRGQPPLRHRGREAGRPACRRRWCRAPASCSRTWSPVSWTTRAVLAWPRRPCLPRTRKVLESLRTASIDRMTPLDALNLLAKLK